MNLGPWTGCFSLPERVTTMLSLSLVGSLNLFMPCGYFYKLECVFLHTLLRMTVFHSLTIQNFHFIFFPRLICHINKQGVLSPKGWDVLRDKVYLRVRGCPTCFIGTILNQKLISTNTLSMTSGHFNPIYIYFCFHNLTIRILHLRFSTSRLKGGG